MKIFNWVHKSHNVIRDGMARNVKKTDSIAIDTNSKDLLEQVALFDVLDGWRYGVLTIGTFGFDPLKSFSQQKDHSASESDEEEEEEERSYNDDGGDEEDNNIDEEVNPLLFGHTLEDIDGSTEREIKFSPDVIMDDSGKLRKRTTLAELFYEESDMKRKPTPHNSELNPGKKACDFCTKKEPSFANKFIPQVGKGSRPIKMLNKMVKRMLKRKIHPELERKDNKGEGQRMQALI